MEVPGRQHIILCQPCQSDGDTVEAEGFCEICNEFICTPCLKAHRKMTVSKNHVIKLKDEMPKVRNKRSDPCSEFCAVHKAKIVKFYCEDHNSVACGDCMVFNHKACTVKLVSDVSNKYDTSQELEQIKKKIATLRLQLESHRNEFENEIKAVNEMREKIIDEIKYFRQEINSYLDNAETDLLRKIDEMKAKQEPQLKHIQREFLAMETEMRECEQKIHQTSDKINDLFVAAKISDKKIKACQMSKRKLVSKCQIEILTFVKSKEIAQLLTKKCPIGEIDVQREQMVRARSRKSLVNAQARPLNCLNVRDKKNRDDCCITGMIVISPDDLLLVDKGNRSLKILNVSTNVISSTYTTDGEPWDITSIDSETCAVTITKGEILFINVARGISEGHSIKVRENCRGIDYQNEILAVSFEDPASVQLLDMRGTILQEIDISAHCPDSWRITLSKDIDCFDISSYSNDTVLC